MYTFVYNIYIYTDMTDAELNKYVARFVHEAVKKMV